MVPENVSMVGAGVMVPQVSSPIGMGAAVTTESGGNVTRPVSSTVPVTASRALVSSKIETEPVIARRGFGARAVGRRRRGPCDDGGGSARPAPTRRR